MLTHEEVVKTIVKSWKGEFHVQKRDWRGAKASGG